MQDFIYSAEPGLLIGFHERALHYAKNPPPNSTIRSPAVLGAVFSLGNCLDLTDKKSLDLVKSVHETYNHSFALKGKVMLANSNPSSDPDSKDHIIRRLDCTVIKKVHEYFHATGQPPFDSVRALFPEGKALYAGAGFRESTHIQIAIRNPNMIKGYFLPRKEITWKGTPVPL